MSLAVLLFKQLYLWRLFCYYLEKVQISNFRNFNKSLNGLTHENHSHGLHDLYWFTLGEQVAFRKKIGFTRGTVHTYPPESVNRPHDVYGPDD